MDRETVMLWLEICGKNYDCSERCPYGNGGERFDCREKLMTDAYELMRATYSVKPLSKPYNVNKNMEECPLDTLVILTDEYNNMYLGTITKERGRLTRGECIHGDAEQFYRNKIVGWKPYQ